MQKCPKCLAEQNNVNSSACFYCGADMSEVVDSNNVDYNVQDDYVPEKSISLPDSDDLGIETTADMMESEAKHLNSSSPLEDIDSKNTIKDESDTAPIKKDSSDIKKLSEEEIKEIESNLYNKNDYINDREKSALMEKISSVNPSDPEPFSNSPIQPPTKEDNNPEPKIVKDNLENNLPKPQISKKGQGLAFFYKNYIKIEGSQKLHPEDEMIINNRNYVLKPKNLNKNIAVYSFVAILLLSVSVVGSFLAGNSGVGDGQVFGLILDENDNPYLSGATIIFDDLNERSQSDANGLFTFSDIPAGSHKIAYKIGGEIIGTDYITIADNNFSFITLKPMEEIVEIPVKQTVQIAKAPIEKKKQEVVTPKKVTPPKKIIAKKKTTSKKKSSAKAKSGYGKLVLNANVDGAKIKVDGSVLGAGNLTYSKIKSGKHSYTISLDGYESTKGSFTIKKGETKTLSPSLKPLTQAKKEKKFKGNDYLYSAKNAFKQADYTTAIADYNKVIEQAPSSANAYYGLGESYSKLKKWDKAYDNFIKSAEINQFKKRTNEAIACYNQAIKVDDKKTTGYLGRGDIYLDAGEFRAALGDFDKVVKLDKRNFYGYFGMGEASFELQRYSKAIKSFKDARSLKNDNTLVHQYLTLAYMYEHDRKNTKKSLEKFNEYASENEKNSFKKNSQYSVIKKFVASE